MFIKTVGELQEKLAEFQPNDRIVIIEAGAYDHDISDVMVDDDPDYGGKIVSIVSEY